jgi:putative SOS response-associated peptidase YedK
MIWKLRKSAARLDAPSCADDSPELAYLLGVDEAHLSFHRPHYNIAPTQEHFILICEYERRKVLRARWGLVNSGAGDKSRAALCINAMA